jgi:hypothetical protein
VFPQRFGDFRGLSATCPGDRQQLSVGFFEILFGFFSFAPGLVLCSR